MPRLLRYALPDVPQHIIQRGNNRQPVFFHADDYRFYLVCLQEAAATQGSAVHAYVLMTNHVHVLLTPRWPTSIAKVMQSLGRRYVQYINTTYHRTGTLWEGRYRASLVDAEPYLLACYRYIELNPVRAGMVQHPEEYPWSSYRWHALGQARRRPCALSRPGEHAPQAPHHLSRLMPTATGRARVTGSPGDLAPESCLGHRTLQG